MERFFRFFIERSFLINIVSLFVVILGIISFVGMKRDLIPKMEFKVIHVTASVYGASAIEMEKNVTFPIEEAIRLLPNLKRIESSTYNSSSSITVTLENNTAKPEELVENIKAKIDAIKGSLPDDIENINVERMKINSTPFMGLTIVGADQEKDEDRNWVQALEDSLIKISGVVDVSSSMQKREVQIVFDHQKIGAFGISIPYAKNKILTTMSYMPIGVIEKNLKTVTLELRKKIDSIKDIANIPLKSNQSGNIVRLKDIAKVYFKFPKRKTLTLVNGESKFITFNLEKNMDSDAILLRDKVKKVREEYLQKMPKHLKIDISWDGSVFIEKQISVLMKNGAIGLFIVCLVLYFFLGARVALVTAIGIPLSYMGTMIVLELLGISFDLISIVGMILVIGILVDDAIIVSEKYVQNLNNGMNTKAAALDAAKSTFLPVTGTILTTIVAFAPILLLQSPVRMVLYAIPCVIIASLSFSWLESYLVLPNHLHHFVKSKSKRSDSKFFLKFKEVYKKVLWQCLRFRYMVLVVLIVFTGFSFYFANENIKKSFGLRIGNEYIQITAILKKSDSNEETAKVLRPLIDYLLKISKKEVERFNVNIGSAWIGSNRKEGSRYVHIGITLPADLRNPEETKEYLTGKIQKKLEKLKTDQFEELYTKKVMKGHEEAKDDIVTIYISGGDKIKFEVLQKELEKSLNNVPNVKSIFFDDERLQSSWQFFIDPDKLIRYSLDEGYVVGQLNNIFSRREVIKTRLYGENTHIYVGPKETTDFSFRKLRDINILSPAGIPVPLKFLGNWRQVKVLKRIEHINLLRKFEVDVRYDNKKTDKDKIVKLIDGKVEFLRSKYPVYSFKVGAMDKQEEETKEAMIRVAIYCVAGIILILMLVLNSLVQPFLVAFAIPFGIIGIIWALFFHNQDLGVMAIIGLIGMAGVVVNDSLIMVDFINKIRAKGKSKRDSIVEGASSRLRPILLTTITTLGGVFPMAYGIGGDSGFTTPLAFAMGWGLAFATILTLLILPALLEIKEDLTIISVKLLKKVSNA